MRGPTARFARPTNRLTAVERFYCEELGFERLGAFEEHDGFDGILLGYPGCDWHIEFTSQSGVIAPAAPSHEHLLVLYMNETDFQALCKRLQERGVPAVRAHNPYWEKRGAVSLEDPDGYRVVLFPSEWAG